MNALVTRIGLIVIVAGIAVGSGKASAGTVTYHVSTQFESDLQYGHTLEIPYYDPSLHGGAALLRGWYSYTMTGSKPIEVFNQGPESERSRLPLMNWPTYLEMRVLPASTGLRLRRSW
jgi:hypothetical protein